MQNAYARLVDEWTREGKLSAAAGELTEEMLEAAEGLAQIASFVWRRDGDVVWSPGSRRILGEEQSLRLDELTQLVEPQEKKRISRLLKLACHGAPINPISFQLKRKDGQLIDLVGQVICVRDGRGEPIGLTGAVMDVTERRRIESRLLQSQKLEAIGTLAGGVAHDFNNFLQVINGHCDLMNLDPSLGGTSRVALEEIRAATARCKELTQRLLAFGRRQESSPSLHDMKQLLPAASRMLARLIGDDIQLKVVCEDSCIVRIDPVQLEQVLVNLAINARDAMPGGGKLTIVGGTLALEEIEAHELGVTQGIYFRISVADTGTGIPEELLSRVFEPFFTTKPVGAGTGLGLSTVHGIVAQLGGAIAAQNLARGGVCFSLFFPMSASEPGSIPGRSIGPKLPKGTETILLVEDGAAVRVVTQTQLEHAGYKVLTAANGEEALIAAQAASFDIDLVVSDVMMPGMNGPELARKLRKLMPEVPVIFMSGYTERLVLKRASLAGDQVALHKPFSIRELLECVREALDNPKQGQSR